MLQAPGRLTADTKLDLAVAPGRFLARAIRMWQPDWAFGQLQNQAVGYLFPMGPVFAGGAAAGLPMWLVQRLWIAGLLVVSMWGAARLAGRLGIGTPAIRALAGAAYALSPAMIGLVGSTSGGQVPAAVLPWVLVPLVDGAAGGSPRRAAARSALAVVAMGAVNAGSTLSALPLAGLWLLTRTPGPRRRRLVAWWVGLVGAATLWWTVALVLQSRYGFDFLPFTETADVTTASMSAVEVLRGAGYWLSLIIKETPWLPAGWMIASHAGVIAASAALTAAGLYGLARRDTPERAFLVPALGLGVAVMVVGYAGPAGGPLASVVRSLLDDELSPLRNLHKFEPTIRLPLALGLAHAVSVASWPRWRLDRRTGAALAAGAVVVGALPLFAGRLLVDGAFTRVPTHWRQTAAWLDARPGPALVVPGAEFGEYRWGRPLDEPLQPLDAGPWAVRNLIPLGSLGATRLLDAFDRSVDTGDTDGLANALGRAGVRHLVVRNDLDPRRSHAPAPAVVRSALDRAPDIQRVAAFGPVVPTGPTSDRLRPAVPVEPLRSVEIYEVTTARPPVRTEAAPATVISGGPESIVDLPDLGDQAVVLAGAEGATPAGPVLLTDSLRRRDVDLGQVHHNVSYVLTRREPAPDTGDVPVDPAPVGGDAHRTAVAMTGAAALSASSYGPAPLRIPEAQPFAAFDGDPASAWVPTDFFGGVGQWVQISFDQARAVSHVDIRPMRVPGWRRQITEVAVSTERGVRRVRVRPSTEVQRVRLPAGSTRGLRVTIVAVGRKGSAAPGLAEVELPGLRVRRPLVLPTDQQSRLASGAPLAGVHFRRSTADPFDATRRDEETRLDRRFALARPAQLELRGAAVARPGPALTELVASLASGPVQVETSSVWLGQPAYRGEAALDGDPATSWVAAADDERPRLDLRWAGPRTIDRIAIQPGPGPTRPPLRLRLDAGTDSREVTVRGSRPVAFAPLTTERLSITVTRPGPVPAGAADAGVPVAIAVAEVVLPGLDGLRAAALDPDTPVQLPCGAGPDVVVNGVVRPTAVDGTAAQLLLGHSLAIRGCDGPLMLGSGTHQLETTTAGPLAVQRLGLVPPALAPTPTGSDRATSVRRWDSERRVVRVGPGPAAYLTSGENRNEGWRATLDGKALDAVTLDGWRQAWVVPARPGPAEVTLTFTPAPIHRAALVAGAIGVLLALGLALVPSRRPGPPASATRLLPVVVAGGLATLAVWVVAGPMALSVPLLMVIAARTGDDRILPAVAGLAYAGAGLLVVLQPGRFPGSDAGAFGTPAQLLSALALGAVLATAVNTERR